MDRRSLYIESQDAPPGGECLAGRGAGSRSGSRSPGQAQILVGDRPKLAPALRIAGAALIPARVCLL